MKTVFFSILAIFCSVALFFSANTFAQDSPQWHLPEGATARLGKGWLYEIQYSPDGTRLAAGGTLGIWMYDTATHEEISLFNTGSSVSALAYSPDGNILAGGSINGTIHLWNPETGETLHTLAEHRRSVRSPRFQS